MASVVPDAITAVVDTTEVAMFDPAVCVYWLLLWWLL
jgi:hypothetical protein